MNILIYIPLTAHYSYKNLLLLSLYLSPADKVTILTFDKAILTNRSILNSEVNVIHKSYPQDPSDAQDPNTSNIIRRIRFWRHVKNIAADFEKYDVLVLDNDVTIDGYTFSKKIPSFVLHSAMDVFNATTIITKHRYRGSKYFLYPLKILEKWIGYKFLPRLSDEFQEFNFTELLIDRLFGWDAKGTRRGLGPSVGLMLSGKGFGYEYEKIGVDIDKIHITGVPQYDDYFKAKKHGYKALKKSPILFFNSSTSNPDKGMLKVVSEIRNNFSNKIIIAGHPRATPTVKSFLSDVANKVENVEVMLDKRSDDENKKLLLNAYFLVQRHSSVGLYAMAAKIPILSYSSVFEHPFDEMYFFLNSKYHARSPAALPYIIKKFSADLNNGSMDEHLAEDSDFVLSNGECCENISRVLHDYNGKAKTKINVEW